MFEKLNSRGKKFSFPRGLRFSLVCILLTNTGVIDSCTVEAFGYQSVDRELAAVIGLMVRIPISRYAYSSLMTAFATAIVFFPCGSFSMMQYDVFLSAVIESQAVSFFGPVVNARTGDIGGLSRLSFLFRLAVVLLSAPSLCECRGFGILQKMVFLC